jgi:hypothetical protein
MARLILVLSFAIFFLFASFRSFAAPIKEEDDKKPDNVIIDEDVKISKAIDKAMTSVDVALAGGKKLVNTLNVTRLTIRNQINWPQGGPFAYNPHLDVRLHLPNFEKKWQLKFITYDQNQEDLGINRDRLKTVPIRNDYAGSIGVLQKLGEVNVEFEPRIQFQGGVQVSYYSKLTSSASTKYFSIHPEAQFFAKSDTGVGEFFAGNIDFPIYKTFTATLINEEQYLDQSDILSTNNGVGFAYNYNDTMSQNYTLIFEFTSRPNFQLGLYTVATSFTHKFYKNVLHYTIQPYLAFSNTIDYLGAPGINFELDLIF